MSAVSYNKANKEISFDEPKPTKVELGLGDKHLYFKNNGLFSENYLVNHLGKSTEPFLMRAWETEDQADFSALYEWMLSTWQERRDEFEKMKEAQLEEEWIRPILQRLGWEYVVQPDLTRHGKRQIPDYALFEDASSKKKALKSGEEGFFSGCALVADAKAMHVDMDGKSLDNSNPSFQIMQYLTYTNKDWGILTNGRYWRLYSLKSKTKFRAFFEINIEKFLNGNTREDSRFKYFFNFFSRDAFSKKNAANQSFIDIVFSDGEQYAQQVEAELKERAFELVELISNGFQSSVKATSDEELKSLYSHSLYYLFRMIFILNCEAKGLLHISRQSDYYKYSIRNICNGIREDHIEGKKWPLQPRTYNQVKDLFKLLSTGDAAIGIHGFGQDVFETGQKKFFDKNEIPDSILNEVLLRLSCQFDKKSKSWAFIDYTRLSIDHMGSIFEGLLEFRLESSKSGLQLVNTSGERHASGSYYTPDYVVDSIVKETLTPVVNGLTNAELLKLKVVDPAMGSAHFLLGVVKFLEEKALENFNSGDKSLAKITSEQVRWEVLHNCVYGVDINPLALELAKFSLWMFTATSESELEPLDDQLKCEDSLLNDSIWNDLAGANKFSAVVGNPPYVRIQEFAGADKYQNKLKDRFEAAKYGSFDLYALFIEKSLEILSKEGRLGFILPHKFFLTDYGRPIRNLIANGNHVSKVIHFGDLQVFKGATTYTCMLFLTKAPQTTFSFCKLESLDLLDRKKMSFIDFPSTALKKDVWMFEDEGSQNLLERIEKSPVRLKEISEKIFQGMITGIDSIFVLKCLGETREGYRVASKELPQEEFVLENNICKPILRGSDISRYDHPVFNAVVIFPYETTEKGAELMSMTELKKNAPKAFAYLSKFKIRLSSRDKIKAEQWWAYSRPQNLNLFSQPKILTQVLSKFGKFTYDSEGEFCFLGGGTAGGNAMKLSSPYVAQSELLLAILNSSVTTFFISKVGSGFRGGFRAFGKASLENLPLPKLNANSELGKTIVALVRKRAKIGSIENSDEAKKINLELEIDSHVCDLYNLSSKDRMVLREFMEKNLEVKVKKAAA